MDAETKDELRDVRDTILDEMRSGFRGVHARQDVTNGRVQKAEVAIGAQDVRIKNVERELFPRVRERGASRRITERDVRMVVAGIGATVAVLTFFSKLLPLLLKAVTP